MANLSEAWTRGIPPDKKEKAVQQIINTLNEPAVLRLVEILEEKLEELNRLKKTDYEVPSWAYTQAHLNGEREAYMTVYSLLTGKRSTRKNSK